MWPTFTPRDRASLLAACDSTSVRLDTSGNYRMHDAGHQCTIAVRFNGRWAKVLTMKRKPDVPRTVYALQARRTLKMTA